MPLDLSEAQLYNGPEVFASARSKLDANGWNTEKKIHSNTWLRAWCFLTPINERILEMSIGVDAEITKGTIE
jgi:hypothetical protein